MEINVQLHNEFNVKQEYIDNIINFLDSGCTVPFIARYRKEYHGTLDDQTIRLIDLIRHQYIFIQITIRQ